MAQQTRYQAIAELETRGREGTFVTQARVPFVTMLSTDPKTGLGGGGEEGATYPALVRVVSRHQQRFIEGTIWSLQTSYYPLRWTDNGRAPKLLVPKDIPEGAVEYLSTETGLKQVGYRDLISARLPNDKEKEVFNLTHSHTVIEVLRTSFADDATPIRLTVTVYPTDRNQIVYDIGAVPGHPEAPA